MRLTTGLEMYACKLAIDCNTKPRDEKLGKMHVYFQTPMDPRHLFPVYYWQGPRHSQLAVDATNPCPSVYQGIEGPCWQIGPDPRRKLRIESDLYWKRWAVSNKVIRPRSEFNRRHGRGYIAQKQVALAAVHRRNESDMGHVRSVLPHLLLPLQRFRTLRKKFRHGRQPTSQSGLPQDRVSWLRMPPCL